MDVVPETNHEQSMQSPASRNVDDEGLGGQPPLEAVLRGPLINLQPHTRSACQSNEAPALGNHDFDHHLSALRSACQSNQAPALGNHDFDHPLSASAISDRLLPLSPPPQQNGNHSPNDEYGGRISNNTRKMMSWLKTGRTELISQLDGNNSLSSDSSNEIESLEDDEQSEDENEDDSANESIIEMENPNRAEIYKIPVITGTKTNVDENTPAWHETYTPRPNDLPTARKTIRQDQRLVTGAALPSFSAPNCRSLGPKLNNFIEDMQMRNVDVALCSETWEKSANKEFQKKVENFNEQ